MARAGEEAMTAANMNYWREFHALSDRHERGELSPSQFADGLEGIRKKYGDVVATSLANSEAAWQGRP